MSTPDICIFLNAAVPEQYLPSKACLIDYFHRQYEGGYRLLLLSDRRVRFEVRSPTCAVDLTTEEAFPFNSVFCVEAKLASSPPGIRIVVDGHVQDQQIPCIPNLKLDLKGYDQWLNRSHDKQIPGIRIFLAEIMVYSTISDTDELRVRNYFLDRRKQVSNGIAFEPEGFGHAPPGTTDLQLQNATFQVLDLKKGLEEGSITVWLNNKAPDWATNDTGYRFAPIKAPGMTVTVVKHPDRTLEFFIDYIVKINSVFQIPELGPKGVFVAVTWNRNEVKLYLAGELVQSINLKTNRSPADKAIISTSPIQPIVKALDLQLSIGPYSDSQVEIDINAKLLDTQVHAGPGVEIANFMAAETNPNKKLVFDLGQRKSQKIVINGTLYQITLLEMGKAAFEGQEFPSFQFEVSKY